MIIAEKENLKLVKVLIDNTEIQLAVWEDQKGNIFISTTSQHPEGIIYFATTPSLLCQFLESSIILQTLFDQTPSFFVEINANSKKVLYSTRDIDIALKCGDATMKELGGHLTVEIWQGLTSD